LPWRSDLCFYTPFTRFGRHGDVAAHGGKPFKAPVLLADTAAVLTPDEWSARLFTGQGLGGNGGLSRRIAGTVHQAYAPVLAVRLPDSLRDRRTA
jgi:CRISPR-associated protein Csm4